MRRDVAGLDGLVVLDRLDDVTGHLLDHGVRRGLRERGGGAEGGGGEDQRRNRALKHSCPFERGFAPFSITRVVGALVHRGDMQRNVQLDRGPDCRPSAAVSGAARSGRRRGGRRADLRHGQRRRRRGHAAPAARRRAPAAAAGARRRAATAGWTASAATAEATRTAPSGCALDDCAPEAAGAAGSAGLVPLWPPLPAGSGRRLRVVVGVVLVGQVGRVAVVDQAAAARDVGVAHEGVAVERQLVEHLAGAQQAGARVDHADRVDGRLPSSTWAPPAAPARRRCRRAAPGRRGCRTSRTAAAPGTGRARGPTRPASGRGPRTCAPGPGWWPDRTGRRCRSWCW